MTEVEQQAWKCLIERASECRRMARLEPIDEAVRVTPGLLLAVDAELEALRQSVGHHIESYRRLETVAHDLRQRVADLEQDVV